MKKNIFVLFTLSVFLFFGCNFISTTSFQSDIATVKINFSQNKANPILNARTIDPGYPENLNNLEWTVTYAGSDGLSKTAETKNGAYLFPVGTWIITATAENLNSNGRFTGSKEVTISTGTNNISITVEFDKDGSGGFTAEYTLTGELEEKNTADFKLFFLNYPSLEKVPDVEVSYSVAENKLTVSNQNVLPAGFYQISLLTTDLEIITLTDDIVEIAAEATSHFTGKAYLDSKSRIYYAVEKEGSPYNGYSPAYRASLTSLLERLKTDASWKTATIKLENKIDGFSPASLIDYAGGRHLILVSEADGKTFAEVKDDAVVEQPAQNPGNGGTGSGGTQESGSGSTGTGSTGTQDPVIPTDPTYNKLYVSSSGSDSNAGASEMTPLKTLERAVELLENGGTIYLMSDITLTSGVSIDKEVSIEPYGDKDITICGLGSGFENSEGGTTSTMIFVSESGDLSVGEDGASIIFDGNKSIQTEDLKNVALIDCWGKAYLYNVKLQNSKCSAISAYGEKCNITLQEVTIGSELKTFTSIPADPAAESSISASNGSAIYITQGATVTFSNGLITGNYNEEGGIIFVNNGSTFTMAGGEISGNYNPFFGGIINTADSSYNEVYLNGGTICNNFSESDEDIYISNKSYLYLANWIDIKDTNIYIEISESESESCITVTSKLTNKFNILTDERCTSRTTENLLIVLDEEYPDETIPYTYNELNDIFTIKNANDTSIVYTINEDGTLSIK